MNIHDNNCPASNGHKPLFLAGVCTLCSIIVTSWKGAFRIPILTNPKAYKYAVPRNYSWDINSVTRMKIQTCVMETALFYTIWKSKVQLPIIKYFRRLHKTQNSAIETRAEK